MNIKDIEDQIKLIKQRSGDDEKAHCLEDDLYYGFVDSIAAGTFEGDIKEAAQLVRTSLDITFDRWHA